MSESSSDSSLSARTPRRATSRSRTSRHDRSDGWAASDEDREGGTRVPEEPDEDDVGGEGRDRIGVHSHSRAAPESVYPPMNHRQTGRHRSGRRSAEGRARRRETEEEVQHNPIERSDEDRSDFEAAALLRRSQRGLEDVEVSDGSAKGRTKVSKGGPGALVSQRFRRIVFCTDRRAPRSVIDQKSREDRDRLCSRT